MDCADAHGRDGSPRRGRAGGEGRRAERQVGARRRREATAPAKAKSPPKAKSPAPAKSADKAKAPAKAAAAKPPDLSTPTKAASAFADALESGSVERLRAVTIAPPDYYEHFKQILATAAAVRKLEDAAVARFGKDGRGISAPRTKLPSGVLEDALENVDGDAAPVGPADEPEALKLRRVGRGWKVDLARTFPGIDKATDDAKARARQIERLALVAAGRVRDGKYASAREARQAIDDALAIIDAAHSNSRAEPGPAERAEAGADADADVDVDVEPRRAREDPDAPDDLIGPAVRSGFGRGPGFGGGGGDADAKDGTAVTAPEEADVVIPEDVPPAHPAPARDVVFVCDASAAMGDTFPALRGELLKAVAGLKPEQRFNVIFYQGGKAVAASDKLLAVTAANKAAVRKFVDKIKPAGARDARGALRTAMKLAPQRLLLLAGGPLRDGDALVGEVERLNPEDAVRIDTILFVANWDMDPDEHGAGVLERLAEQNAGTFKFVAAEELDTGPDAE